MRSHSTQGSALIAVLCVSLLIFVAGIGLLYQFRNDYQERFLSCQWAQAKALAEAGLEDFRAKLERDPNFPPQQDVQQTVFEYSESLGQQGGFQIQSDISLRHDPWKLILVHSRGYLGNPQAPRLMVSLEGEFDISPLIRGTSNPNPHAFQFRLLPRQLLSP